MVWNGMIDTHAKPPPIPHIRHFRPMCSPYEILPTTSECWSNDWTMHMIAVAWIVGVAGAHDCDFYFSEELELADCEDNPDPPCLVTAAFAQLPHSVSTQLLKDTCQSGLPSMNLTASECVELCQATLSYPTGVRAKLLNALEPQLQKDHCKWLAAVSNMRREPAQWHWALFGMLLLVPWLLYGFWVKYLDSKSHSISGLTTAKTEANRGAVVVPWGWSTLCLGGSMPITGLGFSMVTSLQYNFQSVTSTHCDVPNFLPSISACIGDFAPQRYIWRGCIAMMISQRVLDGFVLRSLYLSTAPRPDMLQHRMSLFVPLHLGEHFGLLLLTCISSTENEVLHEAGFILFVLCSLVRQMLVISTFKMLLEHTQNPNAQLSYQLKWMLAGINTICAAGAVVTFVLHNTICVPYLYSLFGVFEWTFVLTNILFHTTLVLELGSGKKGWALRVGPHLEPDTHERKQT